MKTCSTLGILLLLIGCASTDPALRGIPYGLRVITSDESYDITGSTASELFESIRREAPTINGPSYAGEMYWTIQWRFPIGTRRGADRFAPSMIECRIENVETEIEVTLVLPRWTPPAEASEDLVQQWDRYLEALSLHEEGHRKMAIEAGSEIVRTLKSMHAPTCTNMDSDAKAKGREIIEKHRARNQQYDIDTAHGATQGTRWSSPDRVRNPEGREPSSCHVC